jgi:hypothetical protein
MSSIKYSKSAERGCTSQGNTFSMMLSLFSRLLCHYTVISSGISFKSYNDLYKAQRWASTVGPYILIYIS